jgi:hypothetical protein
LKNNSLDVPRVEQYKKIWAQSGHVVFNADNNAGRAHSSDQSKALHPDWRESSGIAVPTVEELHYAHYFLNRAAERLVK